MCSVQEPREAQDYFCMFYYTMCNIDSLDMRNEGQKPRARGRLEDISRSAWEIFCCDFAGW
jgi:hypothetical protein